MQWSPEWWTWKGFKYWEDMRRFFCSSMAATFHMNYLLTKPKNKQPPDPYCFCETRGQETDWEQFLSLADKFHWYWSLTNMCCFMGTSVSLMDLTRTIKYLWWQPFRELGKYVLTLVLHRTHTVIHFMKLKLLLFSISHSWRCICTNSLEVTDLIQEKVFSCRHIHCCCRWHSLVGVWKRVWVIFNIYCATICEEIQI